MENAIGGSLDIVQNTGGIVASILCDIRGLSNGRHGG